MNITTYFALKSFAEGMDPLTNEHDKHLCDITEKFFETHLRGNTLTDYAKVLVMLIANFEYQLRESLKVKITNAKNN